VEYSRRGKITSNRDGWQKHQDETEAPPLKPNTNSTDCPSARKSLDNRKANMNRKTCFATLFVMVLCLMTSGCFNMEQEIFLEPDGSGDLVFSFSMPEFPEATMKDASQQDPRKLIDELKQKLPAGLSSSIKMKEAKEIKRNGVMAYYIVLHFNQLSDVDALFSEVIKSLNEKDKAKPSPSKDEFSFKIKLEKDGELTVINQSFYADLMGAIGGAKGGGALSGVPESGKAPNDPNPVDPAPDDPPPPVKSQSSAKPKSARKSGRKTAATDAAGQEKSSGSAANDKMKNDIMNDIMKDFPSEQTMGMIFSAILKLRFVLHAPKKIAETNADIVLNERIAIWNATLGAFIKENKPIEMKVTY
jgi:hypothetical protein